MSSAGLLCIVPVWEENMTFMPLPSPELDREPILIYLSMSGSVVPMRILESDSIESVKLRIQSRKGFFTRNQKLVCGGRELARSNSLVRDYGVTDGNVMHLVLRLSDIQVINVRTCCGKEFTFNVERCRDVGYVKRKLAKKTKSELVDDQEVLLDGEPVEDQLLINDLAKNNTDAVIHLFIRKSAKVREKNFELSIIEPLPNEDGFYEPRVRETLIEPVIVNPKIELPPVISELINSTLDGLDCGHYPVRSLEGTGGAYFMPNESGTKYLSVFKPIDEEPMALNNPRGLPLSEDGEGLKKGTRVGEGAIRECAVYLLDHPKSGQTEGFAGVPPTIYVKCLHAGFNHVRGVSIKTGSLQMFMENNGSCEDMGPSAFPVEEVHKIAVLDIRMANADRHAGNILVKKCEDGRIELIPIDHGYCLPHSFEDCTFDWLYWRQAKEPFSSDTLEYIKSMDAEKDMALLKSYGWEVPVECGRVFRISTMLLKKGAEKGLTPFAIGNMMCRKTVKEASAIEEIVKEAEESMLPGTSEAAFLESIAALIDLRLQDMV